MIFTARATVVTVRGEENQAPFEVRERVVMTNAPGRSSLSVLVAELRGGLRLQRKAPGTGEESPLAEDPRSPPLSAGYPRFSNHRGDLWLRTWRQRPEGPVQALWPRHDAARMSDPGPPLEFEGGWHWTETISIKMIKAIKNGVIWR